MCCCRSYAIELLPSLLLGLTDEAADVRVSTMERLNQIAEHQDISTEQVYRNGVVHSTSTSSVWSSIHSIHCLVCLGKLQVCAAIQSAADPSGCYWAITPGLQGTGLNTCPNVMLQRQRQAMLTSSLQLQMTEERVMSNGDASTSDPPCQWPGGFTYPYQVCDLI